MAVVEAFAGRWAAGDFKASFDLIADDFWCWWEEPPNEILCRSREEMADRFRDFLRNWSLLRLVPEAITELDPGVVLLEGMQHAVGKVSGIEVEQRAYIVIGIRDGAIARMAWSFDRDRSVEAFHRQLPAI